MSPSVPKIVKDLHQLNLAIFRLGKTLPKPLRPTLARHLEEGALAALLAVRQFALLPATAKPEGVSKVLGALESLEMVSCVFEILFDLRAISDGLFGEMAGRLEEIRRQLHGLRRKYADSASESV